MVKAKELKSSAWDSHTTEEVQQLNIKYDLTKENKITKSSLENTHHQKLKVSWSGVCSQFLEKSQLLNKHMKPI